MTLASSHREILSTLQLKSAPVAIAFLAAPPPGLSRIDRPRPAGCAYWKEASEGRAFYTTAQDHTNCPVGAFTHGVELSTEKSAELQAVVGRMIELKYLRSEEIPLIPRRTAPMQIAAYAPLASSPFAPDMVVFRGTVKQIMLLSEAARAAGVFEAGTVMGRPACGMLPQVLQSGSSAASVGCIGNRVYTDLPDDELYLTVPGMKLPDVLEELGTIVRANAELEKFHRQRAATL
jgi:uncharacterized protein (DUF169 family)